MPKHETIVDVQGRKLALSNLEKVLYPEAGFTKRHVIDYYIRIGSTILPHLKGHPLTLKRYPNGVDAGFFYQKNCPVTRPHWLETARIWSEGNNRWMDYCLAQDLPSLIWAANLASIELHTSLSLCHDMPHPASIVFDLDPGEPANMVQCCQVGLWVRDLMTRSGLRCFAKTSGSKGLQVYVPLNSGLGYEVTKTFAHELARRLEREHSDLVVSDMKKALRQGKVLVDWSQNDIHKTTVCVYSLRARSQPTVSTPVTWDEVSKCLRSGNATALSFTSAQVLERVERHGDLFEPVLTVKQKLPGEVKSPQQAKRAIAADGESKASRKMAGAAGKETAPKPSRVAAHGASPAQRSSRMRRAG
jgi:bifunctional non-homologous end joining protein LigD